MCGMEVICVPTSATDFTGPFLCVLLQIIQEADKVYGVSHSNRISQIDVITKQDALTFLTSEEEQQQEEQQQPKQQQQQRKQQQKQKNKEHANGAAAAADEVVVNGDAAAADGNVDVDQPRAGKRSRR